MSNESNFNWKYLIPGYGIYLINKSDKPGKEKFIIMNIITTLILLGIIGSSGEDSNYTVTAGNSKQTMEQKSEQKGEEKKESVKESPASWKVGDTIKTDKFEIKVSSVSNRISVGGELINEKATDGALFVVVNFNYKNITKEPVSSFRVPTAKIIDPNGSEYDEAAGASNKYEIEAGLNKKIVSDINPGITQKDAAVFEVSKDLWKKNGWKLAIDADKDLEVMIK